MTELPPALEPALFEAPLMPGRKSVLQQYFRVTRVATLPMLLGMAMLAAGLWAKVSAPYIIALLLGGSGTMIIGHYALVDLLMRGEARRWEHRLHIGRSTITVFLPTGEVHTWPVDQVHGLRVIYTGHEASLGWHRSTFNSNLNEVTFRSGGKEHRLFFRLVSPGHHTDFRDWIRRWKKYDVDMAFYDGTSGVPVKRQA